MFKKSYFMLCEVRGSGRGDSCIAYDTRAHVKDVWDALIGRMAERLDCDRRDILVVQFNRL